MGSPMNTNLQEQTELWSVLEAWHAEIEQKHTSSTNEEEENYLEMQHTIHKRSPEMLPLHITWLLPAIAAEEDGKARKLIGEKER